MEARYGKGRIFFILLIFVVFSATISCQYVERAKGYEIPDEISDSIWYMEGDFCGAVLKKDFTTAYHFLHDSLAAKFDKNDLYTGFYPLGRVLAEYQFFSQNIYYQKATFDRPELKVSFHDEEIKPYTLHFRANGKETAVTTALLGDGDIQCFLIMIFGRSSGKWEIENYLFNLFRLEKKDAYDWLLEAEFWIRQSDYVKASYCTRMCGWLLKPGSELMHYENESEILDRMEKANRKVSRYLKPSPELLEIATKPDIVDFYAIIAINKIYPGFVYQTTLPLEDSVAIENECSKLDPVFADYFKNMNHDTIFVKIVPGGEDWSKPKNFLIKKRKLAK